AGEATEVADAGLARGLRPSSSEESLDERLRRAYRVLVRAHAIAKFLSSILRAGSTLVHAERASPSRSARCVGPESRVARTARIELARSMEQDFLRVPRLPVPARPHSRAHRSSMWPPGPPVASKASGATLTTTSRSSSSCP